MLRLGKGAILILILLGLQSASAVPRAIPASAQDVAPEAAATPTATPCGACITLRVDANLRAGAGTNFAIVGRGRAGEILPVSAQGRGPVYGKPGDWWQTPRGWVAAMLAQGAPVAGRATPTPAPPDLVVLGPETTYPVRARVVRGWDYEFTDQSASYDIVVHRDVFGMLGHQIDDANRARTGKPGRMGAAGPLRITLVDAMPHPDPGCPGWGWAAERATYSDPLGLNRNPCRVEHSLYPLGDGAGSTLLLGWSNEAGRTVAVGAAGPTLGDWSTTFFAEAIPWPAELGPADRPDFTQALYRPLGTAHKEEGRWVWEDPFAQIVPTQH